MYYTNNTQSRDNGEKERDMKAQQEKEARTRLTEEFVELLRLRSEDGVRWTGTMMDLMEVTHIAYIQGALHDENGRTSSFYSAARRICDKLQVTPPANPHSYARRAELRKGIRENTFIERYKWLMFKEGVERPLARIVRR